MKVLWLKDSKVGHLNKARGLLRALGRRTELDVIECELKWRIPGARALLSLLGPRGLWLPVRWVVSGLPAGNKVDLILSAGGATQWANAALGAQLGIPNVFLGSLRRMAPANFGLIGSHDPPRDSAPFFRFGIIPSLVTPEAAASAASAAGLDGAEAWGLLIGGDGEGLSWRDTDYSDLLKRVIEQARAAGTGLWVATGRRTPAAVEERLRRMAEQSGLLVGGCWFRAERESTPPLPALMGACSRLCVTADSMSMIHESISSGRPVVAALPAGQRGNTRLMGNLDQLQADGRLLVQDCAELRLGEAEPETGWSLIHGDPTACLAERVQHLLDGRIPP